MFRRAISDSARIYGRQWWRLAVVQLLALLAGSVVVGVVALLVQGAAPDLISWLGASAETLESRALSFAGWLIFAVVILLVPIQFAALVATVRIADRELAGGQPRLRGSVAATASRFFSLLGAVVLSLVAVIAAFIFAPFIVLLGLIGLVVTGILTLVRRRRPDAAAWWPVLRTWALVAIPFAVLWRILPTAILLPVAVVLESAAPFGAVRAAERLAAGRRWKTIALAALALLVTVGLSAGGALLGSLLWAETGATLVGGIVQLFVVPLPIVVIVALYRRAAGTSGRALPAAAPAPARTPRATAGTSPVMTRVATLTIATLVATAGLATSMAVPAAQAATVTGTNVTYVVKSSADSTVTATINSQAAACRVGGATCTIRGALKAAQQDAADGALGATITFSSSMDITLGAGLAFAPDDLAASAGTTSAPSIKKSESTKAPATTTDEPAEPTDEPTAEPTAEPTTKPTAEPADESPSGDAPETEEPADETPAGDTVTTDSEPAAQGTGATISAAPASFVTKTAVTKTAAAQTTTTVAAAQKATNKIVAGKLTIDATGKRVTLDGQSQYQILRVVSEQWNLAVTGLSFSHGYAPNELGGGGALLAGVNKSTVTGSTFRSNNAFSSGGAIFAREITITGSTFITNRATYYGSSTTGGAVRAAGRATVINSTFSANGIGDQYTPGFNQGSDVYGDAGMDIVNSTFVNSEGGSLAAQSGSAQSTVRNSVFTTNWTGNAAFMCSGYFSGSHNLSAEGDSSCQGGSGTRTSALVRALDESGVVPVFPLAQGYNPAVAAGTSCPAVDALGNARPATGCDLGAVEFDGATSVALEAIPNPTVFGTVTFRAQVASASGIVPTGAVTFTIDGTDHQVAVDASGRAEYEVSGLPGGDVVDYSALFLPTAPYDASAIGPFQYTVQQVKVDVTLTCADSGSAQCREGIRVSDAEAVPFIVTVADDRAGTVSLSRTKSGTQVVAGPVALVDGAATISLDGSALGIGSHDVYAIYSSDDDQHIGVSTPRTVAVLGQATVTLTVPHASIVHGDTVKGAVTVQVTGNGPTPTGLVQVGGRVGTLGADGTVVVDLSTTQVSAGTHEISAIYEGDSSYAHAESAKQPFTATVAGTQTRITSVAPQNPNFAKPTAVSVEVTTDAPSTADPAGIVTLLVDGTTTFTGTMPYDEVRQDGTATFEVVIPAGALSAGTHELVAKYTRDGYSADDNFSPSTSPAVSIDTAKSTTTTSVTAAPSPAAYGDQVTLTATVDVATSALVPGGTVTFSTSAGDLGTATLADCTAPNTDGCSVATLRVAASTLGVGTTVITARYSGAADFSASNGQTSNLVVSKATPTVSITGGGVLTYGETRTYSISVTAPGAIPADGTPVVVTAVPQSGASIALGTVALTGGATSITVPTLGTLVPGSYSIMATFAGDNQFRAATGTQPVSISSVTTDISFDALSANTVTYGGTLQTIFTVTSVNSALAPEGDVVLSWLGNEVGRATLSAADNTATPGVRTVSIPATFAGTIVSPDNFWLTAEFVPTTGFHSAQLQADNPEERRRVTVTPLEAVVTVDGSAVMGQPLQATATVTIPGNDFGITPKGAVTFTINKSGAGSVGPFTTAVVNGKADLSKAYINGVKVDIAGTWTIRATYAKSDTETRYVSTNPNNVAVKQVDVDTTGAIIAVDAPEEIAFGSPLKVSVDVSGVTAATGTVRLAGDGITTFDEVELVNGHAELSAPISRLTALGDHQYTVYYSGDTALRASQSQPFTVTIGKIPTSLTLSTTSTSLAYYPAIVGAKVVYSAHVNLPEGANAVGSVRFSRGDVVLGQVGLNVDKVATISLVPDVAWSGDIVAEYLSGNSDNLADSRTTMPHSWVKAPVVVSVTGAATATIGSRAVLTTSVAFDLSKFSLLPADLRPDHNPSGTVTMRDAITGDQCIVQLNPSPSANDAGSASCEFPFTSAGDVFVSGTYSGDDNYMGGTSGMIVHLDKGTPTLNLTTGAGNADRWFGLASLPVSWSVRGPSTGTVTLKLGETVVCSSTSLTGSCDVAVPRVGAQSGGDTFSLSFSGNPLWNDASTSRTGTIIACVPWVAPTVSPSGSASVELLTTANCDNGAGYYDNTPVFVNVNAKAGYTITRISNQGTDLSADQVYFGGNRQSAGINTLPIKAFRAGELLPMNFQIDTEAGCVPVRISTTGISDKATALNAIDWKAQSACSEPVTVVSDSAVVAYFRVDSKVSVGYRSDAVAEHSTFYGWAGLTGDAKFAQRSLYTISAETPEITAAFGPLCYTGVPTLVQPDGGTLTTAIPDQNCAEPQSGKTGWSWGTVGAGKLVDAAGASVRTYFTGFGGDVARYTPTASTRVWNAIDKVYIETRPFTFPITEAPFSITAAYNKCVALTTKVIGDKSLGAPGTITVSTAADCPLVSKVAGETWFRTGATVTLTTAQSKTQKDAGPTGLRLLGWSGLPIDRKKSFDATVTATLTADTTATASYGTNANCKPFNLTAIPSDALKLTTRFSNGENACAVQYGDRFYDQGIGGNVVSIDAEPTALGEGAEIVFAWATKEPGTASGDPGGNVASTWTRSPFLDQELYGTTDIIAYACEFVTIGANVYTPDGTIVPAASSSNINPATQGTLGDFVRTPESDCAVGADPRSGYGSYAWTVGTQLLPITVADPVAYKFTGWSGDVKGANKTPDAALSLVGQGHRASGDYYHGRLAANFTAICYTLSLPSDTQLLEVITQPNCPGGETSSTPGGANASTSKTLSYLGGTNVVIHARDAGDTLFRNWVSGTDAVDEEDAHWASVSMTSNKTVIPYYSSKSVGEQVSTYGSAIGNQMAIMSKKLVGVATATLSAVVQAFIMKASLVAQGIGYLAMGLEELGVHGVGIDGMKNISTAMTSMLAMLYAPFDCITAWSAGGTGTAIYAAQNMIGTAIVTAMSAGAPKAPSTANPLTTLGQLEIQAEKLAANVKPIVTAGTTLANAKKVYDASQDGGIGWESSASDAWGSSGGSVFSSCMMDKTVGMAESVGTVMSNPGKTHP